MLKVATKTTRTRTTIESNDYDLAWKRLKRAMEAVSKSWKSKKTSLDLLREERSR